jgi:hypothetical protein
MHLRSEQLADYIADRLEFITFLACCSALLALLTGMNGQQALAFTALNLPFGLALLLGMALLAPACPLAPARHSSAAGERSPGHPADGGNWLKPLAIWSLMPCWGWRSSGNPGPGSLATGPEPGLAPEG